MSNVLRQMGRYFAAGVSAVALHFIVMTALIELAGLAKPLATTAGFVAGAVLNYLLQHAWVFEADRDHRAAAPTYVLVTALGGVLNIILFTIFLAALGRMMMVTDLAQKLIPVAAPYHWAQLGATGAVFVYNFWANRRFTFAVDARRDAAAQTD